MTAQAGELLLLNGERVWMQTLPLEAFWDANPPRPYMIAESSAEWRGYIGEWEISDQRLYLRKFEATAWTTSNDWIGDEGLRDLWGFVRLHNDSAATGIAKLKNLPTTANAAQRRAARIVLAIADNRLANGTLAPDAPGQDLYQSAVDASWSCFTKEKRSISLATLFPNATDGVFAAWYTGTLRIDEGELLDYQHAGFCSTYEFTRLIEIRDGCVVSEERRKNVAPPPDENQNSADDLEYEDSPDAWHQRWATPIDTLRAWLATHREARRAGSSL